MTKEQIEMREAYLFQKNMRVYFNESDVDEAIEEHYDDHQNNCDPADYIDYADEWSMSVDTLDADKFETFKLWCNGEGLNPSHADSVHKYFKELER